MAMDGVMPRDKISLDITSGFTRHQFDLRIIDPTITLQNGKKVDRLLSVKTNDRKYHELSLLVTSFKMESGSGISWFIEGVIYPVNVNFKGYYTFHGSTGWIEFTEWK